MLRAQITASNASSALQAASLSVDPWRGWKSLFQAMWKSGVESVSATHLKISVPAKRKITVHLKQSRARPLTSADHANSSQLGSV